MRKSIYLMMFISVLMLASASCWSQNIALNEDFENLSLPSGWSQDPSSATCSWSVGSSGISGVATAYNGTNYVWLYSTLPHSNVKLITPMITISDLTNPELSFAIAQPSFSGGLHDTLTVYARTTSTGSWQELLMVDGIYETWHVISEELTTYLGSQTQIQLAFEYKYGNGKGIGLDMITIGESHVCTIPTNLRVFRLTDLQAELMWAAHNASLSYGIKLSTVLMTDLTSVANVLDSVVMDKPFTLRGLSPNTTYYCYINANCGNGDVSGWSEPLIFKTLCSPVNVPYVENFDNYGVGDGSLPTCWNDLTALIGDWSSATSFSSYYPVCYSQIRYNGAASLRLYSYYNVAVTYIEPRITYQLVSLPEMNVSDISDYQVSFKAYAESKNYKMYVGLMTDATDISTFEEIACIQVYNPNSWEEFIVPFSSSMSKGKYIAFYITCTDETTIPQTIYIDNVVVDVIPFCPKPSIVNVSSLSYDAATLNWLGDTTATYRVLLSTTAINPNTATTVLKDTIVTTNSVRFTGLTTSTSYYYYIQEQCSSSEVGEWSSTKSFTTECNVISQFPYKEDFESYGITMTGMDNSYPTCWSREQTHSVYINYPYVMNSPGYANGAACLMFTSSATTYNVSVMSQLGVDVQEVRLNFIGAATNLGYTLEVGVMDVANNVSTFVPIDTIRVESLGSQKGYEVYFNKYQGTGRYIAFRSQTGFSNVFYIDDVELNYLGSCIPPYDIVAENISLTSCDLVWSQQVSEATYRVKLFTTKDSDPNSGTALCDTIVNGTQLNLSGLTKNSSYYLYIASVCGTEESDWHYYYFRTGCD